MGPAVQVRHVGLPALLIACLLAGGCGGGKVSRAKFDAIHTNMAEDEVEAVMGPGQEVAAAAPATAPARVALPPAAASKVRPTAPPVVTKTKFWQDGPRSITVVFANGRVKSKSSRGL